MSLSDIAELLGYLVSAFCVGVAAGYTLAQFRKAMEEVA